MALKGASPDYAGEPAADRWELNEQLLEVAGRWRIDPTARPARSRGGRRQPRMNRRQR